MAYIKQKGCSWLEVYSFNAFRDQKFMLMRLGTLFDRLKLRASVKLLVSVDKLWSLSLPKDTDMYEHLIECRTRRYFGAAGCSLRRQAPQ